MSFGGNDFSINAIEHKDGSVNGNLMWGTTLTGTNNCAEFQGIGAWTSGDINPGSSLYDIGFRHQMLGTMDCGEGQNAPADMTTLLGISFNPMDCHDAALQAWLTGVGFVPITGGNIQVKS
jgi:hypothetical protein